MFKKRKQIGNDEQNIFSRETEFHDQWAAGTDVNDIKIIETFEAITSLENKFALDIIGDPRGKRILDIGSGLGESAIYFAMKGADVTAADISPKMVELCMETAKKNGVSVRGIVTTAENLTCEDDYFDVVFAANVIHHINDRPRMLKNIHGALKQGGLFIAIDPIKYNPLINVYRRMATDVRTVDERPLGYSDILLSKKFFPNIKHREFWLLTLLIFIKYYLIDKKSPNEFRYWKLILDETKDTIGKWFLPLSRLDSLLLRLPIVKALAWTVVQWGTKDDICSYKEVDK
jgi:2-polyprenyl-3-methyl-5-hydroxy-6-metoxy-1,4-benzoquinol methylase